MLRPTSDQGSAGPVSVDPDVTVVCGSTSCLFLHSATGERYAEMTLLALREQVRERATS